MGMDEAGDARTAIAERTESSSVCDRRVLDQLYSATYEELRRLAWSVRRGVQGVSLSPTTLVNEAWVKLAASPAFVSTSRLHFKRIAARAMRQVLVEAARRKYAGKRGGRDAVFVTLDESLAAAASTPADVLALDAALDELARLEPRQARMVELRFFAGLEVAETAEVMQVSEATVVRDWRVVKAWLATTVQRARPRA
jgi:RNA polymerase sigma factor (TIGR02999 family)